MAYEVKNNTGSLFANDKRETDRHPTHTGSGLIDGTEYWINAWVKESQSGKRYFSFSFKAKEQHPQQQAAPVSTGGEDEFDQEVPF